LGDSDGIMSDIAKEGLRKIGGPRVIQSLCHALHSDDNHLRRAAGEALVDIGDASTLAEMAALLSDSDVAMQEIAIEGLLKIGSQPSLQFIQNILHSEDSDQRQLVARKLAKIGDIAILDEMITLLKDPDITMRKIAIEGLKKIGEQGKRQNSNQAVQSLLIALNDEYEIIRCAAKDAIHALGWWPTATKETGWFTATESDIVAWDVINCWWDESDSKKIVRHGKPAIPALLNVLKDETASNRYTVAIALHELGWQPDENIAATGASTTYWLANDEWEEHIKTGQLSIEPMLNWYKTWDSSLEKQARVLNEVCNAQSVPLLLNKARDIEFHPAMTQIIIDVIQKVLESEASQISEEDLQTLESFDNLVKTYSVSDLVEVEELDTESDDYRMRTTRKVVFDTRVSHIDTSKIRELSNRELTRRSSIS
jgi:hypothetical protein